MENYFGDILERAISRRDIFKICGILGLSGLFNIGYSKNIQTSVKNYKNLSFRTIYPNTKDEITIPEGYEWKILIKWGDPLDNNNGINYQNVFEKTSNHDVERQKYCFGYNNDFVGFFNFKDKTLLVVNHEYTNPEIMFKDYFLRNQPTKEEVDFMIQAHGLSIVEIKKNKDGFFEYIKGSKFNRRITAETKALISGPAKGHKLLQTSYDPNGEFVYGTIANCSAGKTPWGTVLSCEENFHSYFGGDLENIDPEKMTDYKVIEIHQRYGVPDTKNHDYYGFYKYHDRFNVEKEPNEANRFGWVVEIDPLNPNRPPIKRTALGRFKHEAANTAIGKDGRIAVYMGDDERYEYLYKFVTKNKFNPNNREKNLNLLDEGTLYVAVFNDDFTGQWVEIASAYLENGKYIIKPNPKLPNIFQEDPALCFIYTRKAADLLNATKMDRPEDVEYNYITKSVFAVMTYNEKRKASETNAANPRPENTMGHIIEIIEENHNPTSIKFNWRIALMCGDPKASSYNNKLFIYGKLAKSDVPPISAPDNIAIDKVGNVWIATDGNSGLDRLKSNDGVYVLNPFTKELKMFLSGVPNCEICGPEFSDDYKIFFCAIQHPGEGDLNATKWPYLNDSCPIPRPAVIQVKRKDGLEIYL
jgi:secreted PhoX family phosphatase